MENIENKEIDKLTYDIMRVIKNEKLELNDKTRIYKNNENMNFIGKKEIKNIVIYVK